MENRDAVLADYFKLRVLLNRTNLNRDQKTEIFFEVLKKSDFDFRLIATLKGIKNPRYIELCRKSTRKRWRIAGYSDLFYLEEFCAIYLQKHLGSIDELEKFRAVVNGLQNELSNLGIARQ